MSEDNSFQDTEESDNCPPLQRNHHNLLERQRRDNIKDSFSSLREVLPAFRDEKIRASRAQILKKAVEFIRTTRQRNEAHQTDIIDLRKENELLEDQIRILQNTLSAGNMVEDPLPLLSAQLVHSELRETSTTTDSSDSSDVDNSCQPQQQLSTDDEEEEEEESFQPQRKRPRTKPVCRKPVKNLKKNARR